MTLITSRIEFERLKARLQTEKLIAFDTETTWTNLQEERHVLGVSISVPSQSQHYDSWYIPVQHLPSPISPMCNQPIEWLHELPWEDPSKKWIAHNAKFDIEVLKLDFGIHIVGIVYDTQVMFHAINENLPSFALDFLGNIFSGVRKKPIDKLRKEFEKINLTWSQIPAAVMGEYAERDTELTFELLRLVWSRWKALPISVRAPALAYVRTLGEMVTEGVMVDVEALTRHSEAAEARLTALMAQLGGKPTDAWVRRRLYEEHRLPVLELTKAGAAAIDKNTLAKLQVQFPEHKDELDAILEYRTTLKAKSTWYDGWRQYVGSDGRIHPGFKQHGTETGRLSCDKPSTHQVPRDGDKYAVKSCILAPEGFAYVAFDYNAIELREAAQLVKVHVGDERMFRLLVNGEDAHHATAELIGSYAYFPPELAKEGRQVGKRKNFLNLYGGSPERLQVALWGDARMDIPIDVCREWWHKWHDGYWGFRALNSKVERISQERGFAKTWNGRRRTFRYDHQWKDSLNFMCQGGGGQCLIVAMNNIQRHPGITSKMINCVHDSVEFYIPLDRLDEEVALIKEVMSAVPEAAFPEMPFPVEETIWTRS